MRLSELAGFVLNWKLEAMREEEDAGVAEDASLEAGEIKREASIDPSASPSSSSPHLLVVKVAHGLRLHEITLPMHATFGDLKSSLAPLTGVYPHEQRLLFKGKQREDNDLLQDAGIKNNSKILLLEDAASKERRLDEARQNERFAKACQAVAHVREEIDKLAAQVTTLEATVESGDKVPDNAFAMLSELLMRQLLKLDSIEAEGEAKVQRKVEVQRVQRFADAVDQLKVKNSDLSKALVVSSGTLEQIKPTTTSSSSTDRECFD